MSKREWPRQNFLQESFPAAIFPMRDVLLGGEALGKRTPGKNLNSFPGVRIRRCCMSGCAKRRGRSFLSVEGPPPVVLDQVIRVAQKRTPSICRGRSLRRCVPSIYFGLSFPRSSCRGGGADPFRFDGCGAGSRCAGTSRSCIWPAGWPRRMFSTCCGSRGRPG
jgi:hypothetical protein